MKNIKSNECVVFPCKQWLSKSKDDGEIARDLHPLKEMVSSRSKENIKAQKSK